MIKRHSFRPTYSYLFVSGLFPFSMIFPFNVPFWADGSYSPTCANSTVHFLLTYRLLLRIMTLLNLYALYKKNSYVCMYVLPPCEWPLKISAKPILAYVQSRPRQMHIKMSAVTGPNFTKFVAVVIFFIDAAIGVPIRPPLSNERGDSLRKKKVVS